MKGGRTFRMRIIEQRQLDVEVYAPAGTEQIRTEWALRENYSHYLRDGALMKIVNTGAPSVNTIVDVREVVNRD